MGTDKEVWQNASARTARVTVLDESLACTKKGGPRYRPDGYPYIHQGLVEVFSVCEADRRFSVNHIVDEQGTGRRGIFHLQK